MVFLSFFPFYSWPHYIHNSGSSSRSFTVIYWSDTDLQILLQIQPDGKIQPKGCSPTQEEAHCSSCYRINLHVNGTGVWTWAASLLWIWLDLQIALCHFPASLLGHFLRTQKTGLHEKCISFTSSLASCFCKYTTSSLKVTCCTQCHIWRVHLGPEIWVTKFRFSQQTLTLTHRCLPFWIICNIWWKKC